MASKGPYIDTWEDFAKQSEILYMNNPNKVCFSKSLFLAFLSLGLDSLPGSIVIWIGLALDIGPTLRIILAVNI